MEWCGYVYGEGLSYAGHHYAAELVRMKEKAICQSTLETGRLNQVYVVLQAFGTHIFRPNAGLYLADMCFPEVEHTKAGLTDTATDGEGKCVVHQSFVEI